MLKIDRANEEEVRLRREAGNLLRWFGRELAAIELALLDPKSMSSKITNDVITYLGNSLLVTLRLEIPSAVAETPWSPLPPENQFQYCIFARAGLQG